MTTSQDFFSGDTAVYITPEALDQIRANARSRHWIDGAAVQSVEKRDLAAHTGHSYIEATVGKVRAHYVSERSGRTATQRYPVEIFSIRPQLAQVAVSITDVMADQANAQVLGEFGKAPGKAMMELMDLNVLDELSTSQTSGGTADEAVQLADFGDARTLIMEGAYDPPDGMVKTVMRMAAMNLIWKSLGPNIVAATTQQAEISQGYMSETIRRGVHLPIHDIMLRPDDNIARDAQGDANTYVFTEDGFIMVSGMMRRIRPVREELENGGQTTIVLTDMFNTGARYDGRACVRIKGDAARPSIS